MLKGKSISLSLFSSQQPNWDYHAEVEAFGARLKERFSTDLLKTAFVNPCYVRSEEDRRRSLGPDAENTALNLRDNTQLQEHGQKFTLVRSTVHRNASYSLLENGVLLAN